MKKLKSLFLVVLLALGANLSAQETDDKGAGAAGSGTETAGAAGTGSGTAGTAGTAGAASTIGGIATSTVAIGAVAVGVAAAIISNNDDGTEPPPPPPPEECRDDEIDVGGVCQCRPGEIEINGACEIDPGVEVFECNQEDGDVLNGDVCEGVRITTTLSGTTTITVPVAVTYLPNIITVPTPQ